MLADSDLLTALKQYAVSPTRQAMCIYGDPAYPLRVNLMAPFRDAALTAQMEAFNKSMSNVRMSVEWLFGDIFEYFKFMLLLLFAPLILALVSLLRALSPIFLLRTV